MKKFQKKYYLFLNILFILSIAHEGLAYVASSTNYRIENDAVSVGGLRSTSTNYIAETSIGGIATDIGTSTSYKLNAGYLAMNDVYIAISSPSDVSMSPAIAVGGGVGNGSTGWTVTTDSPSGYTLAVKAGSSPALALSSDSFSDYAPSVSGTPDYQWTVAEGSAKFGFSPEGSHIKSTYKDNGSQCGTGLSDASDHCWDGFSTSNKTIASSASANQPSGTGTTIKLRAEATASAGKKAGTYQATITATALAQ